MTLILHETIEFMLQLKLGKEKEIVLCPKLGTISIELLMKWRPNRGYELKYEIKHLLRNALAW